MTIYNNWGTPIEILATWQEGHPGTVWKCAVRELDTGEKYTHDVMRLKADKGWDEIKPAIELADRGVNALNAERDEYKAALTDASDVLLRFISTFPIMELDYYQAVAAKDVLLVALERMEKALK